jgi:subtilisin family serine protease
MDRSFTRSLLAAGTLALTLAACSEQPTEASRSIAPLNAANRSVSPAAGRYLVLAKGNGFDANFATTVASLGGTVVTSHQAAGFAVVSGLTDAGAAQLRATTPIAEVDADDVVSLDGPMVPVRADAAAVSNPGIASVLNPAGAILYSRQWDMRAIHADTAWKHGKLGDPSVTVAIIDTGIDYDDLDLNGLVDLSRSVSFSASDDLLRSTFFPGRNNLSDLNAHGTNVAAQVSSKAVAFAGVTSKTTLIGVKVLGQSGGGSFGDILTGVLWAADHHADVANMSLGGSFLKKGAGRFTSLLNRVFNYANKQGMLIVVAAGNGIVDQFGVVHPEDLDHNGNEVNLVCDMPHVVCVSATGPASPTGPVDTPTYYTNFGRSAISVAAPGGNADQDHGFPTLIWPWGPDIASWVWSLCSKTFLAIDGNTIIAPCASGGFITGFIGTSQATPHVSGLAAQLIAAHGRGNPQQIKHLIESSADDLGQPGNDPFFGKGRINVARALGF